MLYVTSYTGSFSSRKKEAAHQHDLSRKLLSFAMEQEYGISLSSLQIETGKHGKPFFPNFPAQFSLSHCRGAVCCALSDWEIGVDIEAIRPYDPRLARHICTPQELVFLEASCSPDKALTTLWTLKESLMKLSGLGFAYGFQNAEFVWESGSFRPARQEIETATFEPFPDFILSVCTAGGLPEKVKTVDISKLS